MKRIMALGASALVAGGLAAGVYAPSLSVARAVPGECVSGPFGGWCDSEPWQDGSFSHCENGGWGGWGYSRCFRACLSSENHPIATDLDPRTAC